MPTRTFNYTGAWQKFDVPKGVKSLTVTVRGGGSGAVKGGYVEGKLEVRGSDVLHLVVGQAGQPASGINGGGVAFGGGGAGGSVKAGAGNVGGDGGGGASYIRLNSRSGPIRAVAGGAGGTSGDAGAGGAGGDDVGGPGLPGNSGANPVGNATGGTQTQPGFGGNSSAGSALAGADGSTTRLARAGQGGGGDLGSDGGGGGGGGFYGGGGGQASIAGTTPGGGGGGGSNFWGGLTQVIHGTEATATGNGRITVSWLDPNDPNNPPTPPQNITINGQAIADGLATKAVGSVVLRGTPNDPDNNRVRMVVRYSSNSNMSGYRTAKGDYDAAESRDKATLTGLASSTRYYVRIYTQDKHDRLSNSYRSTNFWTNRIPSPPELLAPTENAVVTNLDNVTLTWNHVDLDPTDPQTAARIRWRRAATPTKPAGEWSTEIEQAGASESRVIAAGAFLGGSHYEWTVRTRDGQNEWGDWAVPSSFYVTATAIPPVLLYPTRNSAVIAGRDFRFAWNFVTAVSGVSQTRADLRYRPVGGPTWTTLNGAVAPGVPGSATEWLIAGGTLAAGLRYEWQMRTYTSGGVTSEWTESETFWTTGTPGTGAGLVVAASGRAAPPLGTGHHRVFVYDRGGTRVRGEVTRIAEVRWGRKRDDISGCLLNITEWDRDMIALLRDLRSWMHELVVYRDGKRVWEGPVTLIRDYGFKVEIEAKDPLGYVYRRIMRQGYDDSFATVAGRQIGLNTVVQRAQQIILNALAYDDPNLIPYLTPFFNPGDASQSRIVKDYVKTAWEEIDDLAATGGLDYTTVGRRIVLWDTHRPIGRLPEMRDGDFSEPVVITEYGMSYANYFGVTNSNGIWGAASRGIVDGDPGPTGFVEQLASAYGETEGAADARTLTQAALKELEDTLGRQADRNIAHRHPAPLVVRVPDNARVMPEVNLGINQLVPGVWIPLSARNRIRKLSQWQKLDSLEVSEKEGKEEIRVVLSPAPNGGQDPDADNAAEEA